MKNFNILDIRDSKVWLEGQLGQDWIDEQSDKYNKNLKYSHPVIEHLRNAQRMIKEGLAGKKILPDHKILEFLTFTKGAKLVQKESSEYPKLLERLKDSRQFESTAFEFESYLAYKNINCQPRFLPESACETPDLVISDPNGGEFYVECKSKELKKISNLDTVKTYIKKKLKKASSQLSQPQAHGILRIKLPYEITIKRGEERMGQIAGLVAGCFAPNCYKHVSRVVLILPCFENVSNQNGEEGILLKTFTQGVDNPHADFCCTNNINQSSLNSSSRPDIS